MTTKHQKRRGAAAIIAMVLILIIGALAATTMKGIYQDRMNFRHEQVKLQTERLIDDAIARTVAKLETEPDYAGETVAFNDLPLPMPGTLELSIQILREEEKIAVRGVFVEEYSNRKIFDIIKTVSNKFDR